VVSLIERFENEQMNVRWFLNSSFLLASYTIGKTALAREISRALRARTPKIVSAPELLDRWVGGSEKLVRQLFADAEAELASCNNDATKSALHVIVIDEIDAVFRKRSSSEDTGEATRSSVVNQILSKLDGVKSIGNVLLIGMTNRKELLDEALLRPGRMEVQIEIPLPDKKGRREIMNIHFNALRKRGRLSQPLCCAIDGVRVPLSGQPYSSFVRLIDGDTSRPNVANEPPRRGGRMRRAIRLFFDPIIPTTPSSALNLATDVISNNVALAADVIALDEIALPPGAIINDVAKLVHSTICSCLPGEQIHAERLYSTNLKSTDGRYNRNRRLIKKWIHRLIEPFGVGVFDLAADEVTGGFTGADIAGLVRCCGSLALSRARQDGYGVEGLLITLDDVKQALNEVRR
jgi:ATPase family associated with various cellular activities (AAA)